MNALKSMFVALLFSAAVSTAQAQTADVGLVNMLNGDVSYVSDGAAAAKAKPFMKVRQGDRFTLPAGAQVRVVYFQGGRQETWKGPASFRAGAQSGEQGSGANPEVSTLPSGVPQKIAQVPELMQIAKLGRSGGVAVRGAEGGADVVGVEARAVPRFSTGALVKERDVQAASKQSISDRDSTQAVRSAVCLL